MIRAFQWDIARQIERLDVLLALLPRYAAWGYQELYLHLEDAVDYPSLPGIARRDAYSYRQLARLVDAATRVGIGVVPIVNLLGHTQYLVKHPDLRDLNELRAPDGSPLERGQICPVHPRTLEVAEKLIRDMAPFCTTGKVHVGLDESFHLGKHPLSRAEIARIGLAAHFAGHVTRLRALTRAHGLRMGLWADMLCFIPEAIPLLPRDLVAYDWFYYPFRRRPRVEMFNFREYDLAEPLRAHGVEYWGCPMNGSFRFEPLPIFGDRLGNLRSWWRRCHETNAGGFLVTSWEANRLALESTTLVDAAAASLWLEPDSPAARGDDTAMLAHGFTRAFDLPPRTARAQAAAALRGDRHAFAGYARWEINDRWDSVVADPKPRAALAGETFHRARAADARQPAALAASSRLLRYLHARDAFVRSAAAGAHALRRALARGRPTGALVSEQLEAATRFATRLAEGRAAARAMWARSRDRRVRGPNELILAADAQRLRAWRAWLRRCRRDAAHAWTAAPVGGAWQLQFTVRNVAPALQKIVVEETAPGGGWREVRARFTIEFSAAGAEPRAQIDRPFVAPLAARETAVRIVVRGLGRVGIRDVVLTDGVTRLTPAKSARILGAAAPRAGLPELDWTAADHVWELPTTDWRAAR